METKCLKIVFYCSDWVGPQNSCIGLGQQLLNFGHEVWFFSKKDHHSKFSSYGFRILELKTLSYDPEVDSLKEFVAKLADNDLVKDKSPYEKIMAYKDLDFVETSYLSPISEYDPQIKHYLQTESFNLIIVDSEVIPPSIIYADTPWLYLFCSNPIGLFNSDKLPPFLSDFPTNSDPKQWQEFKTALDEHFYSKIRDAQRSLCIKFGYPPKAGDPFVVQSSHLNIYQFPKELDYDDVIEIPDHYFGVDSMCRDDVETFELPKYLRERMKEGDKLVYLSLGSMGSCNVGLMKRFVDCLAKSEHWFIVAKGKFHDQFDLADNMWGGEYLPQTKILSLVDLAILHGGNNGFCEAMNFGKPVIIMPLFYDQFNNAQRAQEKEVGFKMNPFRFKDEELIANIDQLLINPKYRTNAERIAKNIKTRQSKKKLCMKIQEIVENLQK